MSHRVLAIAVCAAASLVLPAEALAAYTTTSVNLRAGPGTGYAPVATIPAGSPIGVGSCSPGWCQVSYAGLNGWVAAGYIAGQPVYAPPPAYYPPPPPPAYYPYYGPYFYGPSFGFYFGGGHGWHHHW
jgi:SH3-like domain-containing protein